MGQTNIYRQHLWDDGLHLKSEGLDVLRTNLLQNFESYQRKQQQRQQRQQHQHLMPTTNAEKTDQPRSQSIRYETNDAPTPENSPDEQGRTKPIQQGKQNNVLIFSSSIAKKVNSQTLERKHVNGTVEIHNNPGKKATTITKYVKAHLEAEDRGTYNTVMLIAGGNDLHHGQRTATRELSYIANTIINDALEWRKHGIEQVCISSVLPRKDLKFQVSRHELNEMLRSSCEVNGFHFMENDNIVLRDHIQRGDGVHLNDEGNYLLEVNILDAFSNMEK